MKNFFRILLFSFIIGSFSSTALAVPPPDFLFNIGGQLIQVFSILMIFLSAASVTVTQFLKAYLKKFKHKKALWIGLAVAIVAISSLSAYFYQQYAQKQAYQEWISESEAAQPVGDNFENPLDQLKIADTATSTTPASAAPAIAAPSEPESRYIQFIRQYYSNLTNGKIDEAYAVSKKSVPLETFRSWYTNTSAISIDSLQSIDQYKYSLRLTLTENNETQSYATLLTLAEDASGQIRIAESQVRTLGAPVPVTTTSAATTATTIPATATVPAATPAAQPSLPTSDDNSFFNQNRTLPVAINNTDFQKAAGTNPLLYVLDAREDEEYDIGQYPGSHHIRFADLAAGEWIQVPTDRVVYVFCWSGMRGKEVADFLRTKNIVARYIENGADDWVNFGGQWNGSVKFSSRYGEARYQKVFTLSEMKKQIETGTVIVDSRPANKYAKHHLPDSINIPMIYTSTSKIPAALAQVPAGKTVITVCDDFISCFDAKVTGIKLEKEGHIFLGRYNKPWEF